MFTIHARNVNEALFKGHLLFSNRQYDVRVISPRNSEETLEYAGPVTTTYLRPKECVLFDPVRDANPFFHVMEAMWILAGRNDVAWLAQFNRQMREYSDDGLTFHGAYGHRLRKAKTIDQLNFAIRILRSNPDTRRCVLQIWDTSLDLDMNSKDIPCNDLIFLKVRDGTLHMTICCRSNDMIWGAYGANAVHFSFIQQYLAGMIGVEVGRMYQISDSFHVYTDNKKWQAMQERGPAHYYELYETGKVKASFPLVESTDHFHTDLHTFMRMAGGDPPVTNPRWRNSFFPCVAVPMAQAWKLHKQKKWEQAIDIAENDIMASDWSLACAEWLQRRAK